MAENWATARGQFALNQIPLFYNPPNGLFHLTVDLRHTAVMNTLPDLSQLSHEQLLEFTQQLTMQNQQLVEDKQQLEQSNQHLDAKVQHLSVLTQKYEHELALFKRHKFAQKNEHLTAKQISLLDEAVEEDIAAVDLELERLNADQSKSAEAKAIKPKRRALPDHLATIRIEHEPVSTVCPCGCQLRRIGEDLSEKLNFRPAQFYKEQHIRGKWVCDQCDTLIQKPMPAYVIDKGIATPELLSHVLVSKYADHLPLYRQRLIYQRAGVDLARSTLSLAKRCFSGRSVWYSVRAFSSGIEADRITTTGDPCR